MGASDDIERLTSQITSSGDNFKQELLKIKKILKGQRVLIKKLEDRILILETEPVDTAI